MNISKQSIDRVTTKLSDSPARVLSVLCLGPAENPIENSFFNTDIDNILKDKNTIVSENDYIELKDGKKYKCFYYDRLCHNLQILDFQHLELQPNERMFIITNIECYENKRVIIGLGRFCRVKMWINDVFVCNALTGLAEGCLLFLQLNKGNNVVFVEMSQFDTTRLVDMFSFRINDINNEIIGIDGRLTKDIIDTLVMNKVSVVKEETKVRRDSVHEFMIIPRDYVNISERSSVTVIVENDTGDKCDTFNAEICKPIRYDISSISDKLADSFSLSFNITVRADSGENVNTKHVVPLGIISDELERLKVQYGTIAKQYELNDEDRHNIEGRIQDIARLTADSVRLEKEKRLTTLEYLESLFSEYAEPIKHERENLRRIFEYIKKGQHFSDFARRNTPIRIYFKSCLDDQTLNYHISLPENYSIHKKYPLVVFLPYWKYDYALEIHKAFKYEEEVIMAEILFRGVNTGSYIGEAAILEVMQIILNKYSIDTDRMYLIGACNGAYASWTMAQAYPYLFTAIATIDGIPYPPNLRNVSNVEVLNIAGDEETSLESCFYGPRDILSQYGNYEGILAKRANPDTILTYVYSQTVVKWLLRHKRKRYPKRIYYRTERIRHTRTYWVEVVSINAGEKYCELEGELVDNSTINLHLTNIEQFVLTIPDFMRRDRLLININQGNIFTLYDLENNKLCFRKKEGKYHILDNMQQLEFQRNSLGMGILDIYMDRLKVVIPLQCGSEDEEIVIKETAEGFSRPQTMGWQPVLQVHYPVVNDDALTKKDLDECNLIAIGTDNSKNSVIEKIIGNLPFRFDERGYEYRGNYKEGKYCLTFIVPNPLNRNKKLLVIYSNDFKLFRKNMFTRQVIIPSYVNGLHPFLNSEAIIYGGKDYLVVNTLGDNIAQVI